MLRNKKFTSVFLADLQRVRTGGKVEKHGVGSAGAAGDGGSDIRPGKFQELQRERAMIVKLLGDGEASGKAKDEKTESKYCSPLSPVSPLQLPASAPSVYFSRCAGHVTVLRQSFLDIIHECCRCECALQILEVSSTNRDLAR